MHVLNQKVQEFHLSEQRPFFRLERTLRVQQEFHLILSVDMGTNRNPLVDAMATSFLIDGLRGQTG